MRFSIQFYIWRFSTQALIDIKQIKINATVRKPWRSNLIRSLNMLTPKLIREENKREMNMQKIYIWHPGCQKHDFRTQFLGLMSAGILAKLHPITWHCISVWVFFVSSSNISKTYFFRTLVYHGFFRLKWERFNSNYSRFF